MRWMLFVPGFSLVFRMFALQSSTFSSLLLSTISNSHGKTFNGIHWFLTSKSFVRASTCKLCSWWFVLVYLPLFYGAVKAVCEYVECYYESSMKKRSHIHHNRIFTVIFLRWILWVVGALLFEALSWMRRYIFCRCWKYFLAVYNLCIPGINFTSQCIIWQMCVFFSLPSSSSFSADFWYAVRNVGRMAAGHIAPHFTRPHTAWKIIHSRKEK